LNRLKFWFNRSPRAQRPCVQIKTRLFCEDPDNSAFKKYNNGLVIYVQQGVIMYLINIMLVTLVSVVIMACGKGGGTSSAVSSSSSSLSSSSSSHSSVLTSSSSSTAQVLSVEIDRQTKKIMEESGATAATIAVAKNGQIIYEQGYGFLDTNKNIATKPDSLMRVASVNKPVTAAAIRKLAEIGLVALSDHVFCDGNNAPCWLPSNLLSETSDSRVKDITIQHLIGHQGGWYVDISGDPFEQEFEIKSLLQLSGPPTREDIIFHVMKRPLDFVPGLPDYIHRNYSNFGYLLLGMIIEQATHTDYVTHVQTEIMAQLGVSDSDYKTGASPLLNHDAREPNYISALICPSVFSNGQDALCSEEGADLKNWLSAGGTIATAKAMALFAQHYRLPMDYADGYRVIGEPLLSQTYGGGHDGDLPGTTTLLRQLPSGVSYAVFINISYNMEQKLGALDRISQLAP